MKLKNFMITMSMGAAIAIGGIAYAGGGMGGSGPGGMG